MNRFSLSVLNKDPKRNYSGYRVIIFYIKVILNSFKHYFKYKNIGTDIFYLGKDKKILFFLNKVYIKFYDYKIEKKYRFLIKNKILQDVKCNDGFIETPFYGSKYFKTAAFDPTEGMFLVKKFLLRLMKIRKVISQKYYSYIEYKFKKLDMKDRDDFMLNEFVGEEKNNQVCLAFVHGDLWSGNIVRLESGSMAIIDWDDLGIKSFSYDIFYYQFQLYNTSIEEFFSDFYFVKKKTLPLIQELSSKSNIPFEEEEYDKYFKLFIMERMLKRYES